jgi:uncharacterized membrane protein
MNTRLALLDYCVRHRLDLPTMKGLWQFAGFDVPPPKLLNFVRAGLAAASVLLLGAGMVCWVAANWSDLGRPLQFGLLEALVLLPCIGAALLPQWRSWLALFAFLAIGALFAYFGQTYQTGADPWQLFALWAALGLPVLIDTRTESIWVAWVIVAMTGIWLWAHSWRTANDEQSIIPAVAGCAAALLLALSLARPLHRFTGAGVFASGTAIVAALGIVSATAFPSLTGHGAGGLAVILIGLILATAAFYALSRSFDMLALCTCALAFNLLVDTAIVETVFRSSSRDIFAGIFMVALASTALCGMSVTAIVFVMRQHLDQETPS